MKLLSKECQNWMDDTKVVPFCPKSVVLLQGGKWIFQVLLSSPGVALEAGRSESVRQITTAQATVELRIVCSIFKRSIFEWEGPLRDQFEQCGSFKIGETEA
jgi:hypothetical protein